MYLQGFHKAMYIMELPPFIVQDSFHLERMSRLLSEKFNYFTTYCGEGTSPICVVFYTLIRSINEQPLWMKLFLSSPILLGDSARVGS